MVEIPSPLTLSYSHKPFLLKLDFCGKCRNFHPFSGTPGTFYCEIHNRGFPAMANNIDVIAR